MYKCNNIHCILYIFYTIYKSINFKAILYCHFLESLNSLNFKGQS